MAKYYDEATFLKGKPVPINHDDGKPTQRAQGDNKLIAELDNGAYKIYPSVTRPNEFAYFYREYARGSFLTMDVRIVPKEAL